MATLEDKLLGEKLQYYCSSSEGEDNDEDDAEGKESCKQSAGATCLDPGACPEPPAGGYRSHTSTNTGPKGVVQDWQRFKQLQAEKREENERQRLELARKLAVTTSTPQEDEKRKEQDDIDAELAELMSEDFLQQFQKQRMVEMLKQCGHTNQFGKVMQLTTHEEYLDCVEKENKHITVIIHIYDNAVSACATLNKCLDTLATEYPSIKFAKIASSVAGMSRDFRVKGLPALLVYRAQLLIGNFVRITDDLSDDFFPSDVESFLIENGVLG
ncbi:phosducin-like protein [Teleopsis dalmanni]|uniref:phosducin-like protein n=1 Tax=Teleopsis dalmanni TaxID=139649 RepID=UPI0018CFC9EF|nr:phosducin-like protein [Teleopsis dalmanni]